MDENNNTTTIQVKAKTRERLGKLVQYPESMDATINRILDNIEGKHGR